MTRQTMLSVGFLHFSMIKIISTAGANPLSGLSDVRSMLFFTACVNGELSKIETPMTQFLNTKLSMDYTCISRLSIPQLSMNRNVNLSI